MPGKHAPESSASFVLSLSRAVGGALAAVAVMAILVFALLDRGGADENGSPAITQSTSPATAAPSLSPTPTPSPTASVLPASEVTIQVLNGNGRTLLAAATAEEFEKAGYKIADVGNTTLTNKSTIFFKKGRRAEALALQELYPAFTVLKQASQSAILRVVLGADWPEQT